MTLKSDIEAGLALLPDTLRSIDAKVQVYATSIQENPTRVPRQLIKKDGNLQPVGPAAGDYQFEKTGGIRGLVNFKSPRLQQMLDHVCAERMWGKNEDTLFGAVQVDPILAAALARLLYFTDAGALPKAGAEQYAWDVYLRTWRPGAYERDPKGLRAKWSKSYAEAMKTYGL